MLTTARQEFPQLGELPGPRVGVLVGGSIRDNQIEFTPRHAARLADNLMRVHKNMGGTLLIADSRRTPDDARTQLLEGIADSNHAFFSKDSPQNPFMGILGWSDYFVTTGDSMTQSCEAIATSKPVYIFAPNFGETRNKKMNQAMVRTKRAKVLDASVNRLDNWTPPALSTAETISNAIVDLWRKPERRTQPKTSWIRKGKYHAQRAAFLAGQARTIVHSHIGKSFGHSD